MSDLAAGILMVLACTVLYTVSWRCMSKGRYGFAVALLMASGLLLRVYTASDRYLHPWDERYHALVAKHLVRHPLVPTLYENPVLPADPDSWNASHIWLHKPPLPLWTIAASLSVFGVNEIAVRIPSILLSTLCIWLTFSIGRYFYGRRAGYIAALLCSLNGLIIELAAGRVATDHIDVFFLFFVELAVFFSVLYVQRRRPLFNVLAGISLGAAILSKWLPALIVLPVWLMITVDAERFSRRTILLQFLLISAVAAAVFLPWQIYIYRVFPAEARWEAAFNVRHITTALEGHGRPLFYYPDVIRINYGELIYLPLLWLFWKLFSVPRDLKHWALFTWVFIPMLFFTFVRTKMQGYIVFTAPALFLITGGFWMWLKEHRLNRNWNWARILLLVLLIGLPARYCIERVKPFDRRDRLPQWAQDLKKLGQKEVKRGVLFNYDRPIEAMFYTDLTAYAGLPDSTVLAGLAREGYAIRIQEGPDVPADVRSIPGVTMVTLAAGDR